MAPVLSTEREQRLLLRRVGFWRTASVLLALLLGLYELAPKENKVWTLSGGNIGFGIQGEHIARIRIDGFIDQDKRRDDIIRGLADNESVKALIVEVNSPGGTVVGSEMIYEAIRHVAAKKPVVATLEDIAASGGYVVAMSADHIVARKNTITGSIGVIFQWPQLDRILKAYDISVDSVRSSPTKALPDFVTPMTDDARQMLEGLVQGSYKWFLDLVKERRSMTDEEVKKVGNGWVYTGEEALKLELVDKVGGSEAAREWLELVHQISKDIDIHEWSLVPPEHFSLMKYISGKVGLSEEYEALLGFLGGRGMSRSGLLVVWQ